MIIRANAAQIPLRDKSVHCVVTSPPYWGLRKYEGAHELVWGDAWRGQLGLEPTIEMYVAHMVEIFREVWRVLRHDGTLFLNLGDSYAASNRGSGGHNPKQDSNRGSWTPDNHRGQITDGLKPKDLCGVPWRVAFALQAEGWYLRSDIIWAKPNPMPESVTDRPTKAHEYIFLLTKSNRYFFDQDAVREAAGREKVCGTNSRANVDRDPAHLRYGSGNKTRRFGDGTDGRLNTHLGYGVPWEDSGRGRNIRSVWEIAAQPYSGAHFATFPEEIPRRCIAAGTSERGCCPKCGAAWERITESARSFESGSGRSGNPPVGKNGEHLQGGGETLDVRRGPVVHSKTLGWQATCKCDAGEPARCVVLDPFAGSGTVGEVAYKMGRRFVLLDLAYQELQRGRIPPMMFA